MGEPRREEGTEGVGGEEARFEESRGDWSPGWTREENISHYSGDYSVCLHRVRSNFTTSGISCWWCNSEFWKINLSLFISSSHTSFSSSFAEGGDAAGAREGGGEGVGVRGCSFTGRTRRGTCHEDIWWCQTLWIFPSPPLHRSLLLQLQDATDDKNTHTKCSNSRQTKLYSHLFSLPPCHW